MTHARDAKLRARSHAMREIELPPELPGPWAAVGELVGLLPRNWVLIGGLMVQIHAFERGMTDVRATIDVDVLGQARPQGALRAIDGALTRAGFEAAPDPEGYAHRYVRGGLVVDVLAPDGMNPPPTLDGSVKAVGVPGGSQALARAETVTVRIGDHVFELRRPTLLGAVLIKARSLLVHHDRESQREDLLRLLYLVEDPRQTAGEMTRNERGWLRRAERELRLDDPSNLTAVEMRRVRLTYRLLVAARDER
jgi:hypothetical protein